MIRKSLPVALATALAALPVAALAEVDAAELFQQQCAMCHGATAEGDGPLAPALIVQPVDLTGLAAANGGEFPVTRVVLRIDGRDPLVAHGSPMPVYGGFFDESGPSVAIAAETGQPILAAEEVVALTEYLMTLQD